MKRYVWLNTATGEFSNSWDEELMRRGLTEDNIKVATERGWKLIEYTCLNDKSFEFYNQMKLR